MEPVRLVIKSVLIGILLKWFWKMSRTDMVTALDTAKRPTAAASLILNTRVIHFKCCEHSINDLLLRTTKTQQPSEFIRSTSCCLWTVVPGQSTMKDVDEFGILYSITSMVWIYGWEVAANYLCCDLLIWTIKMWAFCRKYLNAIQDKVYAVCALLS